MKMWKIIWGESKEFELQGTHDEIEQQLDLMSPLRNLLECDDRPVHIQYVEDHD